MTSSHSLPFGSQDSLWHEALTESAQPGTRVISLSDTNTLHALAQWGTLDLAVPERLIALATEWVTHRRFAWIDVIVSQTEWEPAAKQATSAGVTAENAPASKHMLAEFHAMCDRVENLAIILDDAAQESGLDPWSYLVQVAPSAPGASTMFRLHHPAREIDLISALQVLPFSLPLSFKTLCSLTNGIDLDASGRFGINGIGPSQADWSAVAERDWRKCQRYREVTAQWCYFQGVYDDILAYEAQQHIDVSQLRFQIQRLVPLLMTPGGDYWCLDVESDEATEEYPVVYWDHEARDFAPTLSRNNFGDWFVACMSASLWDLP